MSTISKSIIKCPQCGFEKEEIMPMDSCQFFYECINCKAMIKPEKGDCGVFCSYGSVMFGLALLSVPLEDTAVGELMPIVIGPVLGVLGGIIPLFMYSFYVRLSIMQLIGG